VKTVPSSSASLATDRDGEVVLLVLLLLLLIGERIIEV
jgi:hypothetical protein